MHRDNFVRFVHCHVRQIAAGGPLVLIKKMVRKY